jgi:hypothetical protein
MKLYFTLLLFISINPVRSTVSCGCENYLGYKYSKKVWLVKCGTDEGSILFEHTT